MQNQTFNLAGITGTTSVIDSGAENVKLVMATTPKAAACCGFIDVDVYDRFDFAAIKATHKDGGLITNQQELLEAKVVKVNNTAKTQGAKPGMDVLSALLLLNK